MPFGLEYIAAGASAAGGGASLLAASSVAGPIGLAVGVGLSLFQSISQNEQIEKHNAAVKASADSQEQALNQNYLNSRVNYYDTQNIAGNKASQELARAENGMGFTSGNSINTTIASNMTNTAMDSYGRARDQATQEQQIEYQKQSVAAQARAGMVAPSSPIISAVQGGIQGYSLGSSLGNAIGNYQYQSTRNDVLTALGPQAQAGDPYAIAQIQAISAGANPDLVTANGGNNPLTQSFITQRQIQQLNLQAAENAAGSSGLQLKTLQQYFDYKQGIFNSYGPSSMSGQFLPNSYIKMLGVW